MSMKRDKQTLCTHNWEDLYEFRTVDGAKYLQQKCKKCGVTRYVELEHASDLSAKNDQNSSNDPIK